jgi:hypothetical protein
VPEFRKQLKYNSNTTIYNVFNEVHGISSDMINRIMQAYPEVSYLYLKRGQGVPLRVGPAVTNQKNILGYGETEEEISMKEFLTLPGRVKELEELVKELRKKINNGKE